MAIGRPINLTGNVASKTISVTATANQTEFTVVGGYRINQIDVFRNGVKLTPQTDFQAADASKVVLTAPSNLNDEVSFKIFDTFSVADAIVGAASSQTINGDLVVTGILYSENGGGGGSGGGSVGAAGTWTNYDNNTGVTTTSKVKIQNDFEVTGVSTFTAINATTGSFSGSVSIGGTLTYEDVTNVDSVGLITARSGVKVPDNQKIFLGTGDDLQIYHNGNNSFIEQTGTGHIYLRNYTNDKGIVFVADDGSGGVANYIYCKGVTGEVLLYHYGSPKLVTSTTGVTITGAVAGYDYLQAPFGTTVDFAVTVASKTAAHRYPAGGGSSSNGYVIDGVESPFLTLTPGRTYKFDQSNNTNSTHPLRFYLEADKSTAYTTNVTTSGTPGSAGAYTQIVVTDSTPLILHYQCSAHDYMGNSVNTNSNIVSSDFAGTVSDSIGPLRRLGVNTKSSSYTLLVSDAGKLIRSSGSGAAITLNSGIFTPGDMISVFNVSGGNNTVVQGSGVTLYNTANAATGTRTIEPKGMATIVCTSGSNEFAISGSQLV